VDDLVVIVIGTVTFGVGLAPVYTLSTDLIVSNTRPEQAGVAGAVAESGAELGGALGIALLGSLGVTVFRGAMHDVTEGLPASLAAGAERTLGDAVAIAGALPGPRGDELLQQARSAFEQAYATITGAASLAIVAALVAIAVIRRHARERDSVGTTRR
jgi:DHA2 family multidrug resistance protein-like MFS transporter